MALTKKTIRELDWKDFSQYPKQSSDVLIRCIGVQTDNLGNIEKIVRISRFNAVTFSPRDIQSLYKSVNWHAMLWLPTNSVPIMS